MSEEEKEAIETLKNLVIQEYDWWIDKGNYAESNVEEVNDAMKTILNLIEKQQKEIEELKKDKKVLINNYDKVLGTFISKDKIKTFIKEYLPDDEISEVVSVFDVNGVLIKEKLIELLKE